MSWSKSQRKAILALDPNATFSEDGNTVHTGLDYMYLKDIFDNE